jgi:hypothetical protein
MSHTFTVLDLSTAHLPARLRDELSAHEAVVADRHEFGWWLWVPDDPHDSALWERPPAEILEIQTFSRARGCDWVRFDVDGDTDPDLPTFADED